MTFHPGTVLDPAALEEAVREVDFTPTGVRAWVEGRALDDDPPAGAPDGALLFEATETGQRFVVVTNPDGTGPTVGEIRGAGTPATIWGRATTLDGLREVVIHLEGIGETP